MRAAIAIFINCVLACGGREVPGDAGDEGTASCVVGEIGVCGGPETCAPPGCTCTNQLDAGAGICVSSTFPDPVGNLCPAPEGRICVLVPVGSKTAWADTPFDLGTLLANDGASARVRYADLSDWTAEPVPAGPAVCPDFGAISACGGACEACPGGQTCVGRSPLHPTGFCVATATAICSAQPTAEHPACTQGVCFTFSVQADAQSIADDYGKCIPANDCSVLANAIPGGGKCTSTQ